MKLELIADELTRAFRERNRVVIISTVIVVSNLVLTCYLFTNKERVVIIPANISNEFWTERRAVSKEYLEEMTVFFTSQLLDVTPSSMSYQRNVILRNVAPSVYDLLKNKLIKEEERYKKENLATTFVPSKIVINATKLKALVTGVLTSYVNGKEVSQVSDQYLLKFNYNAGKLVIKSFARVEENEK